MDRLLRRRGDRPSIGLPEFITSASRHYKQPNHLSPLIKILESLREHPRNVVVHTPPRHGKTETLLHYAGWLLRWDPRVTVGYVTYAASLAKSKSRKARMVAEAGGVVLSRDSRRLEEWRTLRGGGMLATGVGGPLTGHGVDVLIVDDPVKNRAEAESAVHREKAWDWFNDVAFTRLEPGASCIVNMARWHQDDLAGRLIAQGWEYLRIPAECDDENDPLGRPIGAALWPDRHDAERLAAIKKQVGPYTWASLYQGVPRPKGSEVFRGVVYGPRPESYRIAIGLDFAYSTKSKSDYSVATVLMQGKKDKAYHVPLVYRVQVEAPVFGEMLAGLKSMYPGAKWYAYIAGPEKGTVDFLNRTFNLKIVTLPCEGDKFNRAQPVAAAWNAGVITVPIAKGPDGQDAPPEWVDDFVTELCDFTGAQDPHDDQVDALAGAYTGLNKFSGWWSEL